MQNFEGVKYRLANNWFSVIPQENKPINYLEIGTFYGANLLSVEETYAKHPESKLFAIDPWINYSDYSEYKDMHDKIFETYMKNIENCSGKNKITTMRGFSHEKIPELQDMFFDIIYIDGNHEPEYILEDAVLSFRKLKSGGYMIFDDFDWHDSTHNDPQEQEDHNTKHGINSFLSAYRNKIDKSRILLINNQMFVKKL